MAVIHGARGMSNKNYISREEALSKLWRRNHHEDYEDDVFDEILEIEKEIKSMPGADVAEVVHGKWIIRSLTVYCTNCNCANRHIPVIAGINGVYIAEENKPPYCEQCGAKMDQE